MRLTDLLALSHVPRWSIVDHLKPQSVADHTFRVVVIAWELSERLNVTLNCSTIRVILTHDAPESRTADIPSPVMNRFRDLMGGESDEWVFMDWRQVPAFAELPSDQARIVKLADKIEGYTFIAKYGTGQHAEGVAEACYREILAAVGPEIAWEVAVKGVITDIMFDKGRNRHFSIESLELK